MKRSEINMLIEEGVGFASAMSFKFPPFAFWKPEEWKDKGAEYNELRRNMLGWDITDFGSADFYRIGLLMFTIRNGNFNDPGCVKPYAEKLLIVREEQVTPYHFHFRKMEDIINRGGGNLMVRVYNSGEQERFADTPVNVSTDGRNYTVPAGTTIRLTPGESITLPRGQYHSFWGEKGCGMALIGEVSTVNDDRVDNRFYDPVGRFPDIEEDEPPQYLLGMDYPEFSS